jgi:hypothetical protein
MRVGLDVQVLEGLPFEYPSIEKLNAQLDIRIDAD